MSEMQLRNHLAVPETRHHCYLKPVPFRLALMTLVGRDGGAAAARLFGMTDKTIDRALAGGVVSEALIANALVAFALNSDRLVRAGLVVNFDQFFQVGAHAEPTGTAAAAA